MSVPKILILIGVLCAIVGKFSLVAAAFRESFRRGLRVLLVPIWTLIFIIQSWEEAKQPLLCMVVGLVLVGSGLVMGRDELSQDKNVAQVYALLPFIFGGRSGSTPAPEKKEETPEQRHERVKADFARDAADLKAKYDALQVQWAGVKGDPARRAAFDKEAAVYAELRKKVEAEKAEAESPIASISH